MKKYDCVALDCLSIPSKFWKFLIIELSTMKKNACVAIYVLYVGKRDVWVTNLAYFSISFESLG